MNYDRRFREAICPVCSDKRAEVLYEITSEEAAQWFFLKEREHSRNERMQQVIRRLWKGGNAAFVRCQNCSFCFSDPFVAGDSEFYSTLYEAPRYPVWKWEFEQTDTCLRSYIQDGSLSNNVAMLEIGAGDGAFVRRIADELIPADRIVTLEYSQYGKQKIESAGITCLPTDVRELDIERYRCHFGIVCMFQVLEHLDHLDPLFGRLNEITTDNALLYIAVPNDRRVQFNEEHHALGDMAPCHVGRWNEKSFQMIAQRFGWRVEQHKREPESKIWRFLEFSLQRYNQYTKKPGSIFNRSEAVSNRLLRYMCQIPLISLMALRSLPLLGQLMRGDLGKGQWVELRKIHP